jgi:hypothetical protein
MKTVKKEIRLGDLIPTLILVERLLRPENDYQKIHGNEKGKQEVLRLMQLGILQSGDPNNPFDKTEEELKEIEKSGMEPNEYDIKVLVDKIGTEGYSPDKHTHIKVYKGNNIVYGTPIFQALKKLYGEDYMVEVKEVIEN